MEMFALIVIHPVKIMAKSEAGKAFAPFSTSLKYGSKYEMQPCNVDYLREQAHFTCRLQPTNGKKQLCNPLEAPRVCLIYIMIHVKQGILLQMIQINVFLCKIEPSIFKELPLNLEICLLMTWQILYIIMVRGNILVWCVGYYGCRYG